jgi:hypothetical protein
MFDNLLNLVGLKIFINQLRSISLVATLVILLSGITVLAINKEGRANLLSTINNITFERNNQNAFLPVPILGNKSNNDDSAKENNVQQSQLDLKSNLTPKPETKKEELKLPSDKPKTDTTIDKKDQPKTDTTLPTIEVPKISDTPAIDPNKTTPAPTKPIEVKPTTPTKPTTPDTTTTIPPVSDTQEITSPPPLGRNMQQN